MKRILLAAIAVVLGILIVVFLRPSEERSEAPTTPGAVTAPGAPSAAADDRAPLGRNLPTADQDEASSETRELTPGQKKAMHRLIHTYQNAQRMVAEVESSEAVRKDLETKRYATDNEGIRAAINSKIPEVKECYESWLGLNPALEGRIVTNFAIEAKKEAEGAGVVGVNLREGGLGNKFLEGCVLSVFSDLEFEVPADGRIEVNYPFIFRTAHERPEDE